MSGPFRLPSGGVVDRGKPVEFSFDERRLSGFEGDTLASALLGAGVRLTGRSFKYHRPRGVLTAGPEEPNALVTRGEGAGADPNRPATAVELTQGLAAKSQNRWPSLGFDLLAANQLAAPILGAGFYYKTFIWPPRGWMTYEHFIRRAAGLGKSPRAPDPDCYDEVHEHCDVLIVGGGLSGLKAALAESETGASVVLAEADFAFGGRSIGVADAEIARLIKALEAHPNVRLLRRTTAVGAFESSTVLLVERPGVEPTAGGVRQRLWTLTAERIVVAAGAVEQPLAFSGNDRPGVMLAGAARTYLNRFGVAGGRRAVVYANNDEAIAVAFDLARAGVEVAAVVDPRPTSEGLAAQCAASGIEYLAASTVAGVIGRGDVKGVVVGARRIDCDHLIVSGGQSPSLQLFTQGDGQLAYSQTAGAYLPQGGGRVTAVGRAAGIALTAGPTSMPKGKAAKTAFVDLQNDVTVADVRQAAAEGYDQAELLKRYTTLGMATDQGRTSQLLGWQALGEAVGGPPAPAAPVRARPPVFPVALGVLAGSGIGAALKPERRTPLDEWQIENGAVFVPAALWRRSWYYPKAGEDLNSASLREALHVRRAVGIADVSTLGKIEVVGPDAGEFLDRIYVNRWSNAPLMRARYGVMLREDGLVFDDGAGVRLAQNRYLITTTTVHAGAVMAHLERHLQVVWPELRARVASVTETWAAMALSGPLSRQVLEAASDGLDLATEAFRRQSVGHAIIEGVPVMVMRMSFSGELGYEIYVPRLRGRAVWEALLRAGAPAGIAPYGLEALAILRTEVGHLGDGELDGRTTLTDLRLERMQAKKDCVGARMARRPALADPARPCLVGLTPADGRGVILAGAQLTRTRAARETAIGRVSSAAFSPALGRPIALGLLEHGRERIGERLIAQSPVHDRTVEVVVCEAAHIPESDRSQDA